MSNKWTDFVNALGASENSSVFKNIVNCIAEPAIMVDDLDEYNDPSGKTRYYKFQNTGLEFGFRYSRLNHVHFYIQQHEGYQSYKGILIEGVSQGWDEAKLAHVLGSPSEQGGGKQDFLIGYIHKWVKYEMGDYSIHFEFALNGMLRKVSLIVSEEGAVPVSS